MFAPISRKLGILLRPVLKVPSDSTEIIEGEFFSSGPEPTFAVSILPQDLEHAVRYATSAP